MSALCIKCNLKMKANMHFANEDRILTRDLFKGLGYKYRNVFDQLAQVTGGVICATLDDEIEVRYINETNDTIDEEYINDTNVNFGEKYRTN